MVALLELFTTVSNLLNEREMECKNKNLNMNIILSNC